MKTALVFPGQASQYPGMGKQLYEHYETARITFDTADQVLGFSISKLCFEGDESELQLTANTQPAILTVSVAAFAVLKERGVKADYVAGHSLGEYSALVAADALDFTDAVWLVHKRGQYMQEAVPVGKGAMAAIIGVSAETVATICQEAAQDEVCVLANINSPSQIVIAGHSSAVERALSIIKQCRLGKGRLLPVSAPFHSPLMKFAEDALRPHLETTTFRDLNCPLVNNVDAAVITNGQTAKESLLRQICSPVRWADCVVTMLEKGVKRFVEVGPKTVLTGLIKQIDDAVELLNVEDAASVEKAVSLLNLRREI
ncbi:MAG: ACP S-malonyltransferase [Acidobacteriota bacterium]|nr:ACP S-malonyltransferase [Blastocatellia bacterium]MDW8412965.1 ACP S-malonyltransferase [Acidobacteriota bacterium]